MNVASRVLSVVTVSPLSCVKILPWLMSIDNRFSKCCRGCGFLMVPRRSVFNMMPNSCQAFVRVVFQDVAMADVAKVS